MQKQFTGNYNPQSLASATPPYKRIPPRAGNSAGMPAPMATGQEGRGIRL